MKARLLTSGPILMLLCIIVCPCFAQVQPPKQATAKPLSVVKGFYAKFSGKKVVYELRGDGKFSTIFSEFAFHNYGPAHSKILFNLHMELSKEYRLKQRSEILFLPNGTCLNGDQKFYNGAKEPSSIDITAQLNWRAGKNESHSNYAFWSGDFHDGSQYISVLDEQLWNNPNLKTNANQNAFEIKNPKGCLTLFFDSISEPTRFLGVKTDRNEAPEGVPKVSRFDIVYDNEGFEGWILSYPGFEARKNPVNVVVKSMEHLDTDQPAKFESPLFTNGTSVKAIEEPNGVYQYFDGQIKKVIDKTANEKINSILDSKIKSNFKMNSSFALSDYLVTSRNTHCGVYSSSRNLPNED